MHPRPVARGHETAHDGRFNMKTVSITMNEPLLGHLDHAASTARKTRSELLCSALQEWLDGQQLRQLVAEDRAGYETHPVRPVEFGGLIAAQAIEMPEPPAPQDGDDG